MPHADAFQWDPRQDKIAERIPGSRSRICRAPVAHSQKRSALGTGEFEGLRNSRDRLCGKRLRRMLRNPEFVIAIVAITRHNVRESGRLHTWNMTYLVE